MKKIIISLILSALLACMLISCVAGGNESSEPVEQSDVSQESQPAENSEVSQESQPAEDSEVSKESAVVETDIKISLEHATEELLADKDSYVLFDDPETDYSFVVFTTDTTVTNLRYFTIISTDTWSNDGAPKIDKVLYTMDEFTPGMIFVAETVFGDVYALRGISFEDSNGVTHYYSLWDSAVDDSIWLRKVDIAE